MLQTACFVQQTGPFYEELVDRRVYLAGRLHSLGAEGEPAFAPAQHMIDGALVALGPTRQTSSAKAGGDHPPPLDADLAGGVGAREAQHAGLLLLLQHEEEDGQAELLE